MYSPPSETEKGATIDQVDTIADHFAHNTVLTYNSINVRLLGTSLGASTFDGAWWIVPVNIRYQSYLSAEVTKMPSSGSQHKYVLCCRVNIRHHTHNADHESHQTDRHYPGAFKNRPCNPTSSGRQTGRRVQTRQLKRLWGYQF